MVQFTRRAKAAWSTLARSEQLDLEGRLSALARAWPNVPTGIELVRLDSDESVWALKYGDLRVLIAPAPGRVEVQDVMPIQRVYG